MNRKEFANALGVTPTTVRRWEHGTGRGCPIEGKQPAPRGRYIYGVDELDAVRAWMTAETVAPEMTHFGLSGEPGYLDAIENAHRGQVGSTNFCYWAVPATHDHSLFRLAIAPRTENGYFPVSEDYFLNGRRETYAEADRLNRHRLNLEPKQAAIIVASSMGVPAQ